MEIFALFSRKSINAVLDFNRSVWNHTTTSSASQWISSPRSHLRWSSFAWFRFPILLSDGVQLWLFLVVSFLYWGFCTWKELENANELAGFLTTCGVKLEEFFMNYLGESSAQWTIILDAPRTTCRNLEKIILNAIRISRYSRIMKDHSFRFWQGYWQTLSAFRLTSLNKHKISINQAFWTKYRQLLVYVSMSAPKILYAFR